MSRESEFPKKSPFPGMDPYLETSDIWPDFHDALATTLSATLNMQLPAPYYARLQKRPELGVITEATVGTEVRVYTDPFQHRFVEIRDAERDHKLVTLIEIASPSNKRPGPDRRAYETQQQDILASDVNLIELDLLRAGRRLLPYPDLAAAVEALEADYLVLLNRGALRQGNWMDYTLYPVGIREPLPCIPVPLAGQDPDVLLDLQVAANRVYREGPYARAVDYSGEPDPPLHETDTAWADELLRVTGLRSSSQGR